MKYRFDKHVTRWAVGVTAAPRTPHTLGRCLASLTAAGFDEVLVCAEPDSGITVNDKEISGREFSFYSPDDASHITTVVHEYRLGAFNNWLYLLDRLLATYPNAQAILTVQDDVLFCRGVRDHLEHDLWPGPEVGLVNLFRADDPMRVRNASPGCIREIGFAVIGALAMVFPRDFAEMLLTDDLRDRWQSGTFDFGRQYFDDRLAGKQITRSQNDHADDWCALYRYRKPADRKFIDTYTAMVLRRRNRLQYCYDPSLTEHLAPVAPGGAIGHGSSEERRALNFPGEDVDAREILSGVPVAHRWNLPERTRRNADAA